MKKIKKALLQCPHCDRMIELGPMSQEHGLDPDELDEEEPSDEDWEDEDEEDWEDEDEDDDEDEDR